MLDALSFKAHHAFALNRDAKDDVPMCKTEEFRKTHGNINQSPYHNMLCIEKNNQNHWVDPMYSDDGALLSSPKKSSVVLYVPYTTENTWMFKMTDQQFAPLPRRSHGCYTRYVDLQNGKYFADPKGCHDHFVRPHGTYQTSWVEKPANPLAHIKNGVDYGIDQGQKFSINFVPHACDDEREHTIKTVIKNAHIDTMHNPDNITKSLYNVYNEGNNAVVELKNNFKKREETTQDHELCVVFKRPTQQKKAPYLKKKQTLSKQKTQPPLLTKKINHYTLYYA